MKVRRLVPRTACPCERDFNLRTSVPLGGNMSRRSLPLSVPIRRWFGQRVCEHNGSDVGGAFVDRRLGVAKYR